jgi:hypothetical protein
MRISLEVRFIRDILESNKQENDIEDFMKKRIWR